MKKKKVGMRNAVIAGMMVGAAVGAMTNGVVVSKKKAITKKAGKAINAVGDVMQSVSAYLR